MSVVIKIFLFTINFVFNFVISVFTEPYDNTEDEPKAGDHAYTYDAINSLPVSDDPDEKLMRVYK